MFKNLTVSCIAAILMLVSAGCQNTVNTIENADKAMQQNVVADSRFVTDGFLRDRLFLRQVNTSRTSDGFLRVQLEAVNVRTGWFSQLWSWMTGENPYPIHYKFIWFDQNGMAMESILSDWRNATVIPGETLYLQSVAPSRDCADFKISLREYNN